MERGLFYEYRDSLVLAGGLAGSDFGLGLVWIGGEMGGCISFELGIDGSAFQVSSWPVAALRVVFLALF